MSDKFLQFTTQHGIQRQHSTQNRPQQNSLTKRANRTIDKQITMMVAKFEPTFILGSLSNIVRYSSHLSN